MFQPTIEFSLLSCSSNAASAICCRSGLSDLKPNAFRSTPGARVSRASTNCGTVPSMHVAAAPQSCAHLRHSRHPLAFSTRRCHVTMCSLKSGRRLKYSSAGQKPSGKEPCIVQIEPGAGEEWKLGPIIEMLQNGAVGIIPTDTLPAIVADLENREAAQQLYRIKEMDPKKPLSILCRNFSDISHYTGGFPVSNEPGAPNWFNIIRRILPGPYTLILSASKNLPSQMVDFMKGKKFHRKSVGVRISADPVCQAVLAGLGRPLLCTSVHVAEHLAEDTEVPDLGSMLESYGDKGVDFIVDVGPRVATVSTVVDMMGANPEVLRVGKGDASVFE